MLSLIIPAYNEEKRIVPVLKEYYAFLDKTYPDFEIIVMVEGTDNTFGVVNEIAQLKPRIRPIYSSMRLGKGGAIINGFKLANGDLLGFVDADGSTPPEAYIDLITNIKDYDCAIASKKARGSVILEDSPAMQQLGREVFNILVRTMFLLPLKDTQCGAKLFRKSSIDSILKNLGTTNWAFDVELLHRAHKKGFKIIECTTTWSHKGGGQFSFNTNFFKLSVQMLLALIRLRIKTWFENDK